jgi:hypothetical protein
MKTAKRLSAVTASALMALLVSPLSYAGDGGPGTCAEVSADVTTAVSKDPSKVLMIVEDALVINETCACEIVKAAIAASTADEALKQQIVQTAIAVAPKMSAIIAECAGVASGAYMEEVVAKAEDADVVDSGKNPKNPVLPVAPPPAESDDDGVVAFGKGPIDIRGVYLIQPAAAGFVAPQVCCDGGDEHDDKDIKRPLSRRKRIPLPLSPSVAG